MRGKYYRWDKKALTDEYLHLDIAAFARSVDLTKFRAGSWQWKFSSGSEASITYIVSPERQGVNLQYTTGDKHYDYLVSVVTTQPNYGGARYWWLCPSCNKRVRILYGGKIFACRKCHNLTYETTQTGGDRMTTIDNRLYNIRRKLGAKGGIHDQLPERPKGMHDKTYSRLMCEYFNLHDLRRLAFTSQSAKLLVSLGADTGLSFSPAELAQMTQEAWEAYKTDPSRVPARRIERTRQLYDEVEYQSPPWYLTLGDLAASAGVSFDFAKETVTEGLIRPDQGRTQRRKRYRERLKNWLAKLWTLREAGFSWEDIRAWTKRRWQPGHESERLWPGEPIHNNENVATI